MEIRVQMASRMKKVKLLIFYTPPLQKHHFGLPMESKMKPQWRLETIFLAIETDDRAAMVVRQLLETFLHLKPTPGERRVQPWGLGIAPQLYIDIRKTQFLGGRKNIGFWIGFG